MSNPSTLPRVVVLCDEPINKVSGGGVTMGNLFRGWPKDRLAQVWAHHRFEIDTDVCTNYLRLGDHKMPGHSWVPERIRRMRKLARRLRGIIRPGIRVDYEGVLHWANAFKPDLLYAQPTAYPMYTWWLPRWLSRDLGIPLVNHIMDDWPAQVEQEWWPIQRQIMSPIMRHQLNALFRAGTGNLAICQQMADAFHERYGAEFRPFHNVIDLEEWTAPRHDYALQGRTFRLVYLGALAEDMQVKSLRDVATVVSDMAQEGMDVTLTVHTGRMYQDTYRQYLSNLPSVSHGGRVSREDLCSCLASADLLVLPVNFAEHGIIVGRYSMPTKVPEYMASATPVLVYGPGEVPAAEYARREGWGYVVDRRDRVALRRALDELMNSEILRARLGRRGRELALCNHDAEIVRNGFRRLLKEAEAKPLENRG